MLHRDKKAGAQPAPGQPGAARGRPTDPSTEDVRDGLGSVQRTRVQDTLISNAYEK